MQVLVTYPQDIDLLKKEGLLQNTRSNILIAGRSQFIQTRLIQKLDGLFNTHIVDLDNTQAHLMHEPPGVLLIDLTVDCAKALQLCYRIKLNGKINHVPVILVGEHVDINLKLAGLQFGANDCMFGEDYQTELVWRINNHIQLCKNLREKLNQNSIQVKNAMSPTSDSYLLLRIIKVVEDNLADPSFSVTSFAKELAMSQIQLYRKVSLLTGLTPNDYIRKMRLQRAADLLIMKTGNISEVAYKVGFTSLSYFAKCFREQFACSPTDFVNNKKPSASHLTLEKSVNLFAG